MKNRDRYINKKNEFDMLDDMNKHILKATEGEYCIMTALPEREHCTGSCEECIQNWLNKGEINPMLDCCCFGGGKIDTLCKQILEYKRLLKLALQDLAEAEHCGLCKYEADDIASCQSKPVNCFVWRYADEALKLIGGTENGET